MVFQALRNKMNKKGFTLVELMIVISIISILAAIGAPLFLAYRTRSFNAAAKAVVHNLKADNGNLNSELGVYGHTEVNAFLLNASDNGVAVANTINDQVLEGPASQGVTGARLAGRRTDSREHAVGVSLGRGMIAYVQDINDANNNSSHHTFARHNRGDTAYAIDSDVENILFSVSDGENWPNSADIGANCPAPILGSITDLENTSGNGAPTENWLKSQ